MKILFIIVLAIIVFLVSLFLFCAFNIVPQDMEDELGSSDYDGTPDDDEDNIDD